MTENFEFSVAPMMDWTDRHCRYFHRLISPQARLYTEMVTTGALLHGDATRFLRFDEREHPVVLQLGGSSADDLARCAVMGAEEGYDEINLNCGCPSDRVQSGAFGACLMKDPALVADCMEAMKRAVDIPVSVKCRIGIDDLDDFEFLDRFVGTIAQRGVERFDIHARKAWLQGLSPKQNREIPVLDYDRIYAIKEKYPHLQITLNGGVTTIDMVQEHMVHVDGVMIGREAYSNPYFLAEIECDIFKNQNILDRDTVALKMIQYIKKQMEEFDTPVKSITRHILGLYHDRPGAKAWKRTLSTLPYEDGAGPEVIEAALEAKNAAVAAQNAA
ncbi:MAG: tRNA dihydrouridine(20/20a) synthase DusA [Rhodospirillales bacterium]|nr:tRNA dihydrouridine(20/20a) synthase DusA [Rhodospirillales bacterium]